MAEEASEEASEVSEWEEREREERLAEVRAGGAVRWGGVGEVVFPFHSTGSKGTKGG